MNNRIEIEHTRILKNKKRHDTRHKVLQRKMDRKWDHHRARERAADKYINLENDLNY